MPRGYRCILVAFVGWLSLATQQPAANTQQAETGTNQSKAAPPVAPLPVQAVKPVEPPKLERPCNRGDDKRDSDLCAQWKAADAARDAADSTRWGVLLGIVGTIGLFWTLFYTRAAVKVAQAATKDADSALEIAERNATAAADLVKVSQASAQKQLRAYVDFDDVVWVRDEARDEEPNEYGDKAKLCVGVSLGIKNFGHTPAFAVASKSVYSVKKRTGETQFMGEQSEALGAIVPTDHVTKNQYFTIPRFVWEAIGNRDLIFLAEIEVSYLDDFEQPHTTSATFESNGRELALGFVQGTRRSS